MSKIKVLMVLGNTGRGGAQTFAINVLRMIDKSRFQIDFVANELIEDGYTQEIYDLGSKIYLIPYFKVYNWINYNKSWKNILKNNRYDIIHGHVSSSAMVYLSLGRKYGCKTIAHSHSAGYRGEGIVKLIKVLFTMGAKKYADYWFACSDLAAKRMFGKNYEKYIHFYNIPNAIIAENYMFDLNKRNNIRNKYNISDITKLYGHVGSFTQPKNHKFLLELFKEIIRINKNSVLLLAGDGEKKEEILSYISSLGIEDNVILVGNVGNVNEYMMAMDTMIFPSFFEGFPVTILEAQATGLPIVLSDTITDEVFLTDCVYPMSLNEDIEKWRDRCFEVSCSDRVKENLIIANSKYNMRNCVDLIMDIYNEMCEE